MKKGTPPQIGEGVRFGQTGSAREAVADIRVGYIYGIDCENTVCGQTIPDKTLDTIPQ